MSAQARYLAGLAAGLQARAGAGLLRSLALPAGVDVTSNDYLGYARDPALAAEVADFVREHGAGAGAARLLRGHQPEHAACEALLAQWCGREAALLLSSGWSANTGLWPALTTAADTVFSHVHNHASTIDGLRLARAQRVIFADLADLARELAKPRAGQAFVAVESVHSMSGRVEDLQAVCALAATHGALVVVDEAHATGLYGAQIPGQHGAGRVAELGLQGQVLCTVHTGGKALGVGGAWIAGDAVLVAHLVNHARAFIYSTGVVPAIVGGLLAVHARLQQDQAVVAETLAKAAWLRGALAAGGVDLDGSASCIVPVCLGTAERALEVASRLRRDGWDARAVRPPTVPAGGARVRLVVRAPLPWAELKRLAERVLVHHADTQKGA